MKIGAPTEQLRGTAGGAVAAALDQLGVAVMTGYHREHNIDDTHATIHGTGPVYERSRTTAMGDLITPPFRPTDYTGGAGTWAVGSSGLVYSMVGNWMFCAIGVGTSTVGGATNTLRIAIPGGFYPAAPWQVFGWVRIIDNGVVLQGMIWVPGPFLATNVNAINIQRYDSVNFAAAGNTQVFGQINFPVRATS